MANWMAGAVSKPGALHRQLGVPQGQKIPASKLAAAAHSSNPTERKRANLAKTFAKYRPAAKTATKRKVSMGHKTPNAATKQDPSGYGG